MRTSVGARIVADGPRDHSQHRCVGAARIDEQRSDKGRFHAAPCLCFICHTQALPHRSQLGPGIVSTRTMGRSYLSPFGPMDFPSARKIRVAPTVHPTLRHLQAGSQ
jgi:hypothetical protein